jgi:hypothetical protein
VYEPNKDFFIISNFFVDYEDTYRYFGDNFYLFVGGYLDLNIVKEFYAHKLITNNYIRYEITTHNNKKIEDAKNVFLTIQRQNTRGWGTVDDELIGFKNKLINATKNYKYLSKKINIKAPICIVGSGPSLKKLLPFIKNNENNMIIFSSGTALKPLKDYGINVDFQIEIERRDHLKQVLLEANIGNTTLIAADIVDPSTLQVAKEKFLFVRSSSSATNLFKPKFTTEFDNPIVGNASFSVATNITDTILLCGIDVGFKKDKKQHIKGSFYDKLNDKSIEAIPTRGNFSNNIYTNSLFSLSREMYERLIKNNNLTVYNLSDGAYIKGAIPTKNLQLQKINKQQKLQELKKAFSSNFFLEKNKKYQDEILEFVDNFFKILNQPIKSKKDLFKVIDYGYYATTIQRRDNPVSGILLSGTFWHILNTLFIAFMHYDSSDLKVFNDIISQLKDKLKGYLSDID